MSDLIDKLSAEAKILQSIAKEQDSKNVAEPLDRLHDAANEIGRSWSGSWLGYQSRVYYANLQPTPAGAHFSSEWGFQDLSLGLDVGGTRGEWREYTFESVRNAIFTRAGIKSLTKAEQLSTRARGAFETARESFLSVLTVSLSNKDDSFLSRLKELVEKMKIGTKFDYARALQPSGKFFTRDTLALSQGFQTPPHLAVLGEVTALLEAPKKCGELATILLRAASHLQLGERHYKEKRILGTKVFFGHGGSTVWRDLKDFVQDRLQLPWDEFNRVPVAGITNIARLSDMLNEAAIAFLVLTAEDEQIDGTMRARENVVHEAGLFQGRLGFTKAIILIEEGCKDFSNIHGLGQIRFPRGNIKAAFEEIRLVLERESVLESS